MVQNSFPGLDFGLGSDIDMLRDTVRAFAQNKVAPYAAEIDRSNSFPRELWPQLGELGLLGVTVEEEWGGAGLGYLAHCVAMEEISRACAAVGLSYGAHSNLCVNQIRRNGSDDQRRRYLPKLISGEHVGALGDVGVRARALTWSRCAPGPTARATATFSTARKCGSPTGRSPTPWWSMPRPTAPQAPAASPPSWSRRRLPGFSTGQKLDKLGMRGSDTSEIVFQDCEVPEANVLGVVGNGVNILMSGLDYERAVLAAGPVGVMQACLDLVIPYVHQRSQFGQPIGRFQLIQAKLADMYVTLNASKSYVYAVARACDRGETTREDAAGAILYAAERATWMALETIQCLGGNGYINDFPAGRLLRDAKLYEIGAGTSEIRRMLIGREIFEKTR